MSLDKVDAQHVFLDLSDYARPLARLATRLLASSPIRPVQITLTFTALGVLAGLLYAFGELQAARLAGGLLIVKSFLDAIDGSLARARQRPSQVGRFLDSVCDYIVNAAVLLGIAWAESARSGSGWPFLVTLIALEMMTWHGTTFNYYYVVYRHLTGGDTTSQTQESGEQRYPWDNPAALGVLFAVYNTIYGWQDRWMAALDKRLTGDEGAAAYLNKGWLTAVTAMGLGFQLLLFAVLSWLGKPDWIPWLILGPYNLYWIGLMLARRRLRP